MANMVIKKNFVDGDKLFAQQLNNNFETIEKAVNDGNKIIWQDGTEVKFKRLITEAIENLPIQDGAIIYDIKKGAHYADYKGVRTVIGGDAKQIKISPTEPTTGEEVWIQKGKNLFDIRNLIQISSNGLTYTPDFNSNSINVVGIPTGYSAYLLMGQFKPEHDFIISLNGQMKNTTNMQAVVDFYKNDEYVTSVSADYYIEIDNYDFDHCNVSIKRSNDVETNEDIQVLVSYVDDPVYEPYIDKKIHTKNDNGIYEEIYNEQPTKIMGSANITVSHDEIGLNQYIKVGNVCTYCGEIRLTENLPTNEATTILNGLPKPAINTRFVAYNENGKACRLYLGTDGGIINWFNSDAIGGYLNIHITYVTES